IGTSIDVARHSSAELSAPRLADLSTAAVFKDDCIHEPENGFRNGDVDFLSLARLFRAAEGHDRSKTTVKTCDRVTERDTRADWLAARFASEIADTAHGFANRSEPGPILIRAGLAKPGDVYHDKPGVQFAQQFVSEAPLRHFSRPEILDHNMAFRGESAGKV